MTLSGADPGFWKGGGPTLEDFEMSQCSRRGDSEDIVGGECERGLNPLSLVGGLPQKISKFGCFLLQARYSSALFPDLLTQHFSRNLKKEITT